jgi:electron transfer flavoprotein beta subunit
MAFNCVVLAKWVPDTKNITVQAMKEDGTVNRAALPGIFNPEDLNALEMALDVVEREGGTVTVMTMGASQAGELLREALYRGASRAILLTDRRFAVADTLATSYTLARAIQTVGGVDLVFCGRQAIDGDTAQVGPQTAEKLGWPQITYVERIETLTKDKIVARRSIGRGYEVMEAKLPCLLTVVSSANEPRPAKSKALIKYKNAKPPSEVYDGARKSINPDPAAKVPPADIAKLADPVVAELKKKGLLLEEWKPESIQADLTRIGRDGSPTKVKEIEFVVIKASDTKQVPPTDEGLAQMVRELIADHTIG